MSVPVMVVISILLAVHLLGLLALAQYASIQPSWTSFAILRLGGAIGRELPAVSAAEASDLPLLDEKAGGIGDAGFKGDEEEEAEIGELVLGGAEVAGK